MLLMYHGFPGSSAVKNLLAMQETWVRSLGWEDPLGKKMATHSSVLAWEIHGQRSLEHSPWGPRVGYDLATKPPPTHFHHWCCPSYQVSDSAILSAVQHLPEKGKTFLSFSKQFSLGYRIWPYHNILLLKQAFYWAADIYDFYVTHSFKTKYEIYFRHLCWAPDSDINSNMVSN